MKSYDIVYLRNARSFEDSCRMVGDDELADRVRAAVRRPGRPKKEESGESEGPSTEGQSVEGQSAEGPPAEGRSTEDPFAENPSAEAKPPAEGAEAGRHSDRDSQLSSRISTAVSGSALRGDSA